MTLPISFTTTPTDSDPDPADVEAAYEPVTDVTDANFEKINAYLRQQKPRIAQSAMITNAPGPFATGVWTNFAAGTWAPLTITLPSRPHSLVVSFGAMLECMVSDGRWIGISWRISGGTTFPNTDSDLGKRCLLHSFELIATSRIISIPAYNLTPGGSITITPCFYANGTGTSMQVLGGNLVALALAS